MGLACILESADRNTVTKVPLKLIVISFFLGKTIGEICIAPAEIKPEVESNITWQTKSKLGDQNWKLLKSEFVEWVGPWTYLSLGEFLKIFALALVSLMSSNWDIWSDGLMWHEYYFGTIYVYYFINQSHPSIGELNCTAIDTTVVSNVTFYTYNCFKTEKLLGVLTLIPIFLPGMLLSSLVACALRKSQSKIYSIICLAMTPLICASFPLLVLVTKVVIMKIN